DGCPEPPYGPTRGGRTDQYSLAALSYGLLPGRRPLGVFPPPARSNPRLSRELDAVILRGLSEEPKDRFPSVREFVAALDRGLRSPSSQARRRSLAIVAAITILASAAVVVWFLNYRSTPRAGNKPGPAPARPAEHNQAAEQRQANPVGPGPGKPADEPKSKAPERSPEFTRLVELRAYTIWHWSGRPMGAAGEAVKEKNWLEAERQIQDEVADRAYRIWERQGRPTGAAGEAVSEKHRRSAEAELLQETEAEMRRHPID